MQRPKSRRPETWFIDIDGCLLTHACQGASGQTDFDDNSLNPPLKKARQLLDLLEARGDHIVLTTGRKEAYRPELEAFLKRFGFVWDQLVMGLPGGCRIVVNDSKPGDDAMTCRALTITRNEGPGDIVGLIEKGEL